VADVLVLDRPLGVAEEEQPGGSVIHCHGEGARSQDVAPDAGDDQGDRRVPLLLGALGEQARALHEKPGSQGEHEREERQGDQELGQREAVLAARPEGQRGHGDGSGRRQIIVSIRFSSFWRPTG
jgi:hypothetical protein